MDIDTASPLADRIVLVAGATRGAGRGIAVAFGAADAWGYLVDVRERGLARSVSEYR